MNIQVTLRKQSYGGHDFRDFRLKVAYDRYNSIAAGRSWVDLDSEDDLIEKLEAALLNQTCPVEVKAEGEVILDPGDKISRLHLRTLIEKWSGLDLGQTPWLALKKQIDAELEARQHKRDVEDGRLTVEVTFDFDSPVQQAGSFRITTKVARWLGTQLLALADGNSTADGAAIQVQDETRISEMALKK